MIYSEYLTSKPWYIVNTLHLNLDIQWISVYHLPIVISSGWKHGLWFGTVILSLYFYTLGFPHYSEIETYESIQTILSFDNPALKIMWDIFDIKCQQIIKRREKNVYLGI